MTGASETTRPTRTTLVGLLAGTGVALVAAMGPLVSAITITIGVEKRVGEASGLPDASGAGGSGKASQRRPSPTPPLWGNPGREFGA